MHTLLGLFVPVIQFSVFSSGTHLSDFTEVLLSYLVNLLVFKVEKACLSKYICTYSHLVVTPDPPCSLVGIHVSETYSDKGH